MILYGRPNADGGPGGGPGVLLSESPSLGEGAAAPLAAGDGALDKGGGSIDDDVVAFVGNMGAGNSGISSSADEVSIVISFVGCVAWRSV